MPITELNIQRFRNLKQVKINTGASFNIFFGENGSGKTSLLEAIHYLGLGKSFRTHLTQRIIQHEANDFLIHAKIEEESKTTPIGMMRHRDGSRKIRLNGEKITKLSLLVKQVPVQLISIDSHRYFHDGPKPRREFLDWGLFHVEPTFLPIWRAMQHTLKQRNAGLKQRRHQKEIQSWNEEFAKNAACIDEMRQSYTEKLAPIVHRLLEMLLDGVSLQIRYTRGWNKDRALEDMLQADFQRDMQLGYTQSGPHRADCQLYAKKTPVQDVLSQGQQKLAAYALRLGQGLLMHQETGKSPIYLMDDMASELDPGKRECITASLRAIQSQVFITGITTDDLKDILSLENHQLFHVKQGTITLLEDASSKKGQLPG